VKEFKFNLGDGVRLLASGEAGTVKGRAEYAESQNAYYILYKAADGRQVRDWWGESDLQAID
jgi:hypothetical protein